MDNHGFRIQSIGESGRLGQRTDAPRLLFRFGIWLKKKLSGGRDIFSSFWKRLHAARKRRGRATSLLIAAVILIVLGMLVLIILWFTLPNIDDPATMFPAQSTVILDRNGVELYRLFSEQDRTYVRGDRISNNVKEATIAIEDERFLERGGCFDVIGFSRAVLSQIAPSMFVRSGGSTLTQQFAKNALVGRKRSVWRKVRELMLACQLEHRYDKNELLELYLNWIPYGQNAYGIEQAARTYFATSAKDLSLAQSAVLAGMLQRPSYFSPYGSHRYTAVSDGVKRKIAARQITAASQIAENQVMIGLIGHTVGSGSTAVYVGGRTDQVLKNMLDQKMISPDEYNKALSDFVSLHFAPERQNIRAPHFVLSVQNQVQQSLGIDETILQQGGLRITTTLDWDLQQAAEKAVKAHRDDVRKRFGANNMALVSLSPITREILAYVGNADFADDEHEGKIDMARSPRQPGSSFKAFTYLSAYETGYGPGSVVYDVPTKFGTDEPDNYDGTFWGLITMRQALGGSRNIPAIKAFFLGGGEEPLLSLAARMGVTTPSDLRAEYRKDDPNFSYGWPLAIGAAEVPLLEMVQGYATIADGGMFRPVTSILKITDKDGNIRYSPKEETPQQVIDPRLAAQITSVLSDVSVRPNDYWKSILSVPGFTAAAKTGTSNKCLERDTKGTCKLRRPESTWVVGYTPNLITGVWIGNATSQSLFEKADGLTTAAPVWHDYMADANRKLKNTVASFTLPPRINSPMLSRLSGKLASACTPVDLQAPDLFPEENTPTEQDPACVLLSVDKVTGLLSSPACPADAVEEKAFFIPKSELPDRWPLWEQNVQDWAAEQMVRWNAAPDHSGSLLKLPVAPTKECDPSLTPGRFDKPSVSVTSPTSGGTVTYPAFTPEILIDSKSPLTKVEYFVDNKPLRVFTEEPFTASVRAPRTIDRTGTHTFKVVITDTYFNTAEAEVMFTFE